MKSEIEALVRLFKSHRKFVLTTHVNPDGDGLGSEIALSEWLTSLGKEVVILNHNPTPGIYRFLDPKNQITHFDHRTHGEILSESDVIAVLDTNHPTRLRSLEQGVRNSKGIKVCIDHHLDPDPFADRYLLDDSATSTGELIYRIITASGEEHLSPEIAQALYCAIMTDTGSFRYSHVDPEIHRIVANLIECGADPGLVYGKIYEQWTPGRIRLLGETLASLTLEYGGSLAHVTIDQGMLKRTGTEEADTDNFTVYPMSVEGVKAGILFIQLQSGVKMSLRSRGKIPINELAKEFGGNGHRNAAGAQMEDMDLAELRTKVVQAAEKYL